jgi:hypothetical protein
MTGRSSEQVDPEPRRRVAEQDVISGVVALDPSHYGDDLVTGADGRIALPELIPGATYSVQPRAAPGPVALTREFTVRPGKTIDLGHIPVEKPPT